MVEHKGTKKLSFVLIFKTSNFPAFHLRDLPANLFNSTRFQMESPFQSEHLPKRVISTVTQFPQDDIAIQAAADEIARWVVASSSPSNAFYIFTAEVFSAALDTADNEAHRQLARLVCSVSRWRGNSDGDGDGRQDAPSVSEAEEILRNLKGFGWEARTYWNGRPPPTFENFRSMFHC